jgi:hypothetical protein
MREFVTDLETPRLQTLKSIYRVFRYRGPLFAFLAFRVLILGSNQTANFGNSAKVPIPGELKSWVGRMCEREEASTSIDYFPRHQRAALAERIYTIAQIGAVSCE